MSTPVVVYGTGSIGMRHLRVLSEGLGVPAIAVPTRSERLDELRAAGWPVCESLAATASFRPQAAVIATDTGRHVADALAAMAAGCHVLIEKPVAPTAKDVAELVSAAQRFDRQVYVGCCLRFAPGLRRFREHLPRLGALHAVRIECQSHLPDWRPGRDHRSGYAARPDEGGVLRDLIHEIDYALWLFGRPSQVSAKIQHTGRLGIACDDGADLLWQTPDGANLSLRLDYLTRKPRRLLSAFGEHGELIWDALAGTVTLDLAGGETQSWSAPHSADGLLTDQARAFLAATAGGDPGPLADLNDGGWSLALCDAARQSAVTGRQEPVLDWRKC